VLGGLVVLLIVILASPLSHYLGSRHDVSSAARQLRDDQTALRQLSKQKAQWSDPGYIQQQARIRLQYAMPGDTVYVVAGRRDQFGLDGAHQAARRTSHASQAWTGRLWASVRAASG
jgi:cell division protein FtsB